MPTFLDEEDPEIPKFVKQAIKQTRLRNERAKSLLAKRRMSRAAPNIFELRANLNSKIKISDDNTNDDYMCMQHGHAEGNCLGPQKLQKLHTSQLRVTERITTTLTIFSMLMSTQSYSLEYQQKYDS